VSQVNELTMQNEYQLRLKDMTMNERIKEMSDKFAHELDADKAKFELLLQVPSPSEGLTLLVDSRRMYPEASRLSFSNCPCSNRPFFSLNALYSAFFMAYGFFVWFLSKSPHQFNWHMSSAID
jgi:hypothetical protein